MGDTPQTVNNAVKNATDALHFILTEIFEKGLDAYLRAQAPWLNMWGVSFVYSAILDKLTGYVYQFMAEWTVIGVIDVQVWVQRSDYDASVVALRKAKEAALAEMDQAAKDKNAQAVLDAQKKFRETAARLIHADGSYTP